MKKRSVKIFVRLQTAALLLLSLFGACGGEPEHVYRGENYRRELETPTGGNLYGMMYIAEEGYSVNGWDYKKGMSLMKNLGVQMIRLSIPAGEMFPTMTSRNEEKISLMHEIIAEAHADGIELIGTFGNSYLRDTGAWTYSSALPRRELSDGSYYQNWLEDYEENWYRVTAEFSEIDLWEIGNEPNFVGNYLDGGLMTLEERAEIYTDELYAASSGMHRADKSNISIMGAITEPEGLGNSHKGSWESAHYELWGRYKEQGRAIAFLNYIYDFIDGGAFPSPYYDDYFQCAAWHPYTFYDFDADYFAEENGKIYETIKTREGKDKRVYITEFGFSDGMLISDDPNKSSQEIIAEYTEEVFETVKTRMPYVETVCIFRAFNDTRDRDWGGGQSLTMYGLFYDPNPSAEWPDYIPGTDEEAVPGAPKPAAYAYQRAAGGNGSLELMMKAEK